MLVVGEVGCSHIEVLVGVELLLDLLGVAMWKLLEVTELGLVANVADRGCVPLRVLVFAFLPPR